MKGHYGYVIVFCCFLIMFVIVGMVMSTAGIFYQPVSESLGVEIGDFGIYQSINFFVSTLTLTFAGKLMDRYSARWILTGCSLLVALTYIVMFSFNSLWQFYVAGAVFGFSMAFLLYLGFATMLNRWFRKRMGIFIGICSAGSGIGGIVFNPLAGYLITEYGWRETYLVFGLFILIAVTPVLGFLLRSYPEDKGLSPFGTAEDTGQERVSYQPEGISYKQAIVTPIFYALIVFGFLMNATATLNIFIPSYVQSLEFSIEEASFAASAAMLGVTIGKVVLGAVNDRSQMTGVNITTLLGIAGLVLILFGHSGLWFTIVGSFFFGWAYAGVSVQTPLLVRKVFGSKDYSKIYSNISMSLAIGGAVAAAGWGLLADGTSFTVIFIIGAGFLLICDIIGITSLKIKIRPYANKQ